MLTDERAQAEQSPGWDEKNPNWRVQCPDHNEGTNIMRLVATANSVFQCVPDSHTVPEVQSIRRVDSSMITSAVLPGR